MQKCVIKFNPAVLLQIFQSRRSLLEVKGGADPGKNQGITMVRVHPTSSEIAIYYDQQELIDQPNIEAIVKEVTPAIGVADIPDDISAFTTALQEIADMCVHKLGAPRGEPFDIPTFLAEKVAPFIFEVADGGKKRVN